MMSITHDEVRRHPRWREELHTPVPARVERRAGSRLLVVVGVLIVLAAVLVLVMN